VVKTFGQARLISKGLAAFIMRNCESQVRIAAAATAIIPVQTPAITAPSRCFSATRRGSSPVSISLRTPVDRLAP
jgi:hypothetical protein